VDLSAAYRIPATGSCQVNFKGRLLEVRGSGAAAPGETLHDVRVEGDPITFQLS
jgi:hypothetical protein